jgi:hypothetical protein
MANFLKTAESGYNSAKMAVSKQAAQMTGKYNEQILQRLYNMDAQMLNVFEILLYPVTLGSTSSAGEAFVSVEQAARSLVSDMSITNLYLQKVQITFPNFTYERADFKTYIKDVEYAESITLEFLEDDSGTVRSYIAGWLNSIGVYDSQKGYLFNDNQAKAKKNAKIFLLDKQGTPNDVILAVYGLKPIAFGELELDQKTGDAMIVPVSFSIENAEWVSLSGKVIAAIEDAIVG